MSEARCRVDGLQELARRSGTGVHDRHRLAVRGRADPDFPGSAAMCCHCLLPVTPEAAGSSPVDPANIPRFARSVDQARRSQALRQDIGLGERARVPSTPPTSCKSATYTVQIALGTYGRQP